MAALSLEIFLRIKGQGKGSRVREEERMCGLEIKKQLPFVRTAVHGVFTDQGLCSGVAGLGCLLYFHTR